MISRELALALHASGLPWSPTAGDRFTMVDPAFVEDVFTLADMTVETQGGPGSQVLGFNGTTEWALDSVDIGDALWLPREDQLREHLGEFFRRLERRPAGDYAVVLALPGRAQESIPADDPADAYALAVLAQLAARDT